MVNEEDAVEVVDFVLKSAGEAAGGLDADFGAVNELGLDSDFVGAGDKAIDEGDGEAAFVVLDSAAVGLDNLWVDEGGKSGVRLVFEVVTDNDDALINAHLGGGHGGREFVGVIFFPVEASLSHVGDNLAGLVGNL